MSHTSGNGEAGGAARTNGDGGEGFLVVGIGASAGGIGVLKEFFSHVPADSGMAYVVILHLSPDHDSQLAEVLQHGAALPVTQVGGRTRVEPDHVYVIPPNRSLSIHDGHLSLSDVAGVEGRRAPVDIFFRTLAESHESRAVSVVLSGTGADGSMGMKRVKEMGGLCLAQDPAQAEYDDMPRNSIATGLVDLVVPVAEMPGRIIAYRNHLGRARVPVEPSAATEADEQALSNIYTLLRTRTGHDFTNYKRASVMRRIERRMNVHQLADLPAYAGALRGQPGETTALLKDLLISVTNFFRDREAFETLERDVVPALFDGKGPNDQVRVWVAGCATGEEAYSVAMQLCEYAEGVPGPPAVQVFATDIDERAVAVARRGLYTLNDAADVSPERLHRFFRNEAGGYRVRKELRELVLFAHHNVIKEPPFSQLDLITCRNLVIYLNHAVQARLMSVFHFALKPGGYLFLGSAETVAGPADLFVPGNKEHKLFRSRAVEPRVSLPSALLALPPKPARRADAAGGPDQRAAERLSYADVHQRLLEQYGPPSVVVNEDYEILHMSERAGLYMRVAGGKPSHNLLKLVRPEVRMELRTALHQAVQGGTNVEARGVGLRVGDETHVLNLVVRPVLRADDPARGLILVLFDRSFESGAAGGDGRAEAAASPAAPVAGQLEDELVRVRAHLLSTVEQYEMQTEELRASNEELQAANEELRSVAQELETGREELQSVNEELTTVNQELKIKIEELSEANDDLQNLMASTEIGVVFLDRALNVKLFTPGARAIFNLILTDMGRPLSHITNKLVDGDLSGEILRVAETLQASERQVQTDEGRWFLMRALPYRTSENFVGGVVVTFLDIDARKAAEESLRRNEERLRLLLENAVDYSIIIQDAEGRIEVWNTGAERMFGFAEAEAVGRLSDIIFTPEDRAEGAPEAERQTARKHGRAADERWHLRKDGSRFYVSGVQTALVEGGELSGFIKIARDLTESKRMEEELRRTRDESESRVRERTRELAEANESLRSEIGWRAKLEQERKRMLRRLVRTQEDERRRISRDIHDHLGQQSTALRLKLEALRERCAGRDDLRETVRQAQEVAARLDADMDFLAWELRPAALDDLGLAAALNNFGRQWATHFGIPVTYHTAGLDRDRVSHETEINLYRITQEALSNVYKHARARSVEIIFERRDDHAVLIVEDNGVGFDPEQEARPGRAGGGLGLVGMRERAALVGGTLEIESSSDAGTTVFVRVPLAPEGEPEEDA